MYSSACSLRGRWSAVCRGDPGEPSGAPRTAGIQSTVDRGALAATCRERFRFRELGFDSEGRNIRMLSRFRRSGAAAPKVRGRIPPWSADSRTRSWARQATRERVLPAGSSSKKVGPNAQDHVTQGSRRRHHPTTGIISGMSSGYQQGQSNGR